MDNWTIRRMLDWMQEYLARHDDPNPLVSARWLISDAAGLSPMGLYTNLDRPLEPAELDALRTYAKRRAAAEPLQYITGKTQFRLLELQVRKGVLIPRPETEVLVSELLKELSPYRYCIDDADCTHEPSINVADICTGSGCIACSLAFEHPRIKVTATDIAPECVQLAKDNAQASGVADRVEVIQCDLGCGVDIPGGGFDAVVSNPPYVPTDILDDIPEEVSGYEPTLALDGGADGLDFYRRLIDWANDALSPSGILAVELHETTLDEAAALAKDHGFADTRIAKDLADRPRVLIAYKEEKHG